VPNEETRRIGNKAEFDLSSYFGRGEAETLLKAFIIPKGKNEGP